MGGAAETTFTTSDEGDAAREDDGGVTRVIRYAELIAAEEHGGPLRARVGVLGRRDRVIRKSRENEPQPIGVVHLQGDSGGATTEEATIHPFGDAVSDGGVASDIKFAATEDDVAGID